MPECEGCKRYFHVSHRICPNCGEYEAPEDEFLRYMVGKVETEFEMGTAENVVWQMLIESGLSSEQTSKIMAFADQRVSKTIRKQGLKRLITGFLAALAAVIVGFIVPKLGVICVLFAIAAIASGFYSLVSGRDLPQKTLE